MTERSPDQLGHLDEGTIHAWLDGALSADEARAVETHVAACARCAAAVAEARGLIAAASRILLALDDVPGGVLPSATPSAASSSAAGGDARASSPEGSAAASSVTSLDAARDAAREVARDAARRRRFRVTPLRAAAAVLIAAVGTTVVVRQASHERATAGESPVTFTVARHEAAPASGASAVAPTSSSAANVASAPPIAPSVGAAGGGVRAPVAPVAPVAPRASRADERADARPEGFVAPRRVAEAPPPVSAARAAAKAPAAAMSGYADVGRAPGTAARAAQESRVAPKARVAAPAPAPALSALARTMTPRPVIVAGVVRDVQGNVLPGVSVSLGKLDVGAVTDSAGRYVIANVPPGRYVAQARRIGYASAATDLAVAASGRDTTTGPAFTLAPQSLQLSEVVVSGAPAAAPRAAARARQQKAGAVAAVATDAAIVDGASASRAAGCYDLGSVGAPLPPRVVLDTARAAAVPADERDGAFVVRAPAGSPPLDLAWAYWTSLGGDSVRVVLLDRSGAGVVLRARAAADGLRGVAIAVGQGARTPRADALRAPRCAP